MKLFGLKNCDTCRRAIKALPGVEVVDVRADGVPQEVLAAALAQFGAALINTRSTTWRTLQEADRALEPLALLQAHPSVMKRPLIVAGAAMYLGWGPETQAALGV